jgi:hypothetical protein
VIGPGNYSALGTPESAIPYKYSSFKMSTEGVLGVLRLVQHRVFRHLFDPFQQLLLPNINWGVLAVIYNSWIERTYGV